VFLKWVVATSVRKETAVCQGNCSQLSSTFFLFLASGPMVNFERPREVQSSLEISAVKYFIREFERKWSKKRNDPANKQSSAIRIVKPEDSPASPHDIDSSSKLSD
jgi:hypothetical protein